MSATQMPPSAGDAAEDVTDRVPEDALDDRGTFQDPALAGERNDPDDLTAVNPRGEFNEPAPQRTAFGAPTVAGAAAAAAQAGPSHEVRDVTDLETVGAAGDRAPDADTWTESATVVEEPVAGLWGEGIAQGYRDRWRDVQLHFADDPQGAVREANLLVEEAVGTLTAELSSQREALRGWSSEDTEQLRDALRRHRDFLDRLLGL